MLKKKMSGFVKFVLLVLGGFFVIAVSMTIVLITSPHKTYVKQQPMPLMSLKDGTLIVYAEVMRVTGIPKEIKDSELAFKFVTGRLKKTVADGKIITFQPQTGVQYTDPWSVTPK